VVASLEGEACLDGKESKALSGLSVDPQSEKE